MQSEYAFRWLNGRILTYLCYKFDTSIMPGSCYNFVYFYYIENWIEKSKDWWLIEIFVRYMQERFVVIIVQPIFVCTYYNYFTHWNINVRSWFTVFQTNENFNLELSFFLFNKCFKYNFHYFRGYFWKFRENARNLLNKAIINMIMILSSLVMIKSLSSLILKIDFTEKTGFFNKKKFRD